MTSTAQTPLSDANSLDAVVHALGIEDSATTPTEAVAELKGEIEALRTALAIEKLRSATQANTIDRLSAEGLSAGRRLNQLHDAHRDLVAAAIALEHGEAGTEPKLDALRAALDQIKPGWRGPR